MPPVEVKPTPAAPAAPAPAPAPAAPAPAPVETSFSVPAKTDNPFAELEAKVAEFDKPLESTKGKQPEPKPEPKPEPAKPEPAPAPAPAKAPGPKELRAELDRWKQEAAAKADSVTSLEAKIKDYESRGKDTEALTARLTAIEKERDAALAEVRAAKQEASPEFIKQFKKPFDEAAAYATHVIKQLTVTDPESQATRLGTPDDLDSLYAMPINKASAVARQQFGDDAPTVINHLNELHRLNYQYQNALKDEREHAQQRAKEEEGKQVAQREQLSKVYRTVNQELAETNEDYRDPPDDKEASDLRQKGYSIFDSKPETVDKQVIKRAHERQMVASFFPMKLTITRLKQKVAELEAKLTTEKEPEPGKPKRPGGVPTTTDDGLSWEDAAKKELGA